MCRAKTSFPVKKNKKKKVFFRYITFGRRFLGELCAMNVCVCVCVSAVTEPATLGREKPFDFIVSGINAPNSFTVTTSLVVEKGKQVLWLEAMNLKHWKGAGDPAQVISLFTRKFERAVYTCFCLFLCVCERKRIIIFIFFFTCSSMRQCTYSATPVEIQAGSIIFRGGASQGRAWFAGPSHVPVGLVGALEICFYSKGQNSRGVSIGRVIPVPPVLTCCLSVMHSRDLVAP